MHRLTLLTFIIAFSLAGATVKAQNLFAIDTIRNVQINFYDSNWDYLLDSLATATVGTGSGTERILAQVIIDGTVFDSCGVRYKGNSSMDTASMKNPFNIDLNWIIQGQQYMGKNKIKLANCYTDPSMVREALMYEISNQYMDCPHASFVRLTVNGNYLGLYTHTESIDNEFLDAYYGSSSNAFFKCDPISFTLIGGNSNLAYVADTMAYDTLYDMKSTYGLFELQELCYNLANNTVNIEDYLDVDRALWFLALSSAFVHNDGYTTFGHNYYLYKMDNGRWSIVLWDVNMSFGGLVFNGTNWLPLTTDQMQTQDPYLHATAYGTKPLIAYLLSVPKYKKIYTAHYRTILEENILNELYLQRAEFMSALIDADAQNETYNEYTYQEISDNVYNDVGTWYELRPGIENLMESRSNYLSTLPAFQYAEPVISNVTALNTQPQPFTMVGFTANVSNANAVQLGYRSSHFEVFTKVPMYDDGLNNDGAAGDGIYGAAVPIGSNDLEYYIYAQNANAAKFSPVRAEYEFYVLSPQRGITINEICALNTGIAIDQNFEYDDWIEFYNNTTAPISLNGYGLSDNPGNPYKWTFPDTLIAPDSYLIVWADVDTFQTGLHANFSLSSLGESLMLTDNFGFTTDEVTYPQQVDNITWGRFGNGVGNFMFLYPTFNAINTTPVGLDETAEYEFSIFPNPASEAVYIQFMVPTSTEVSLIDARGSVVLQKELIQTQQAVLNLSNVESGVYFIRLSNGGTRKLIVE